MQVLKVEYLLMRGRSITALILVYVWQVDIYVTPGTHSTEAAVNKQLNDKERVAAALENPNLVDMVNHCLSSSHR